MKKAVLITIGNEVLSGTTIDTNSNFIAKELSKIGIAVTQIFTISDEVDVIKNTLQSAFDIADLVIATGGLGPTKDDRTKKAFCEFFKDEVVYDEVTFQHLKSRLERIGRLEIIERNREQAMILSKAKVFQNHNGTAPSLMVEENGKIAICLPGVPYEVKPLIKDQIIPYLQKQFEANYLKVRTVSVVNYPESLLSDALEDWELNLPSNFSLSYLPIANRVKLKLTASGKNMAELDHQLEEEISKIRPMLSDYIIADYGDRIEEILHDYLTSHHLTISTAESCTGGELSHLITGVSGSSKYFLGGVCTYQTEKKSEILGVSEELIQAKTVVSAEVAQAMSLGCQKLFHSDIAVSTTGTAGPLSDEFNTEVGKVFYSIRIKDLEKTHELFLPHLERKDFMNFVSQKILQDLIQLLIKENV